MTQLIRFETDDGPVQVTGDVVHTLTTENNRMPRWMEATLVKTPYGWACYVVGKSRLPGEVDRPTLYVAESDDELILKVGQSKFAQALYDAVGLRNLEWIE